MGFLTAPATLMGWLWYSAIVTVTTGSTSNSSIFNSVAIAFSSSEGIIPSAFICFFTIGRRIMLSVLTRMVLVISGASYTLTATQSVGQIFWAGRFPVMFSAGWEVRT